MTKAGLHPYLSKPGKWVASLSAWSCCRDLEPVKEIFDGASLRTSCFVLKFDDDRRTQR